MEKIFAEVWQEAAVNWVNRRPSEWNRIEWNGIEGTAECTRNKKFNHGQQICRSAHYSYAMYARHCLCSSSFTCCQNGMAIFKVDRDIRMCFFFQLLAIR